MDFGILHLGTSISLVSVVGLVFYFSRWQSRVDVRLDHLEKVESKIEQIFTILNEIKDSVSSLKVTDAEHRANIDRLSGQRKE